MVPLFPISGLVTDQSIAERLSYDPKRNTLFVNFKDLTISSEQDIKTIVDGIRARVKQGAGDKKVKCVANYTDVSIRKDLIPAYWAAAQELGKQCYLRCAPPADSSPAAITDSPKTYPSPGPAPASSGSTPRSSRVARLATGPASQASPTRHTKSRKRAKQCTRRDAWTQGSST